MQREEFIVSCTKAEWEGYEKEQIDAGSTAGSGTSAT